MAPEGHRAKGQLGDLNREDGPRRSLSLVMGQYGGKFPLSPEGLELSWV